MVLLPNDWLRWTETEESTLRDSDARTRKDLKATCLLMVLTGKASSIAAGKIAAQGWALAGQ